MVFASFSTASGAVINALYVVACVYVYVSLIRQIAARISTNALEPSGPTFGFAEAVLAVALVAFFLATITVSLSAEPRKIGTREIIFEVVFQVGLLLFIVAFLRLRRLDLNLLGGFSKIGLRRTLFTGTVLLIAAYPLIALADVIVQHFLRNGAGSSRQMIVEVFTGSETIGQRVLIIFLAVVLAPIVEEFLFRFFLYGVFKRYCGWFLALALNSLLFAAAHVHFPSFAPLFALGCCLTIAYEWSGSILVSMTMHALFNAVMLTLLAFPEILPQ
jgi:membrane protease YdiL (CAAX protease family)